MYRESEFFMLSAIQHWAFCKRQCALAHKEQIWIDNYLTAKGDLFHQRVDTYQAEKRKNHKTEFSVPIHSLRLGISGRTDILEVDYAIDGSGQTPISAVPVEYKSGGIKKDNVDELQLAAQVLCLEEMMDLAIPTGYFYYGRERRRVEIPITEELRDEVHRLCGEIHTMLQTEELPPAVEAPHCKNCSLAEICQPSAAKKSIKSYFNRYLSQV